MRIRPFPSNSTRNDASVVFTVPLRHHAAVEIQHTVVALPITDIQPHDRVIPRHDRGRTVLDAGAGPRDVDSSLFHAASC